MTSEIEFSQIFKLLNALKEGDDSKKESLNSKLFKFKTAESAKSFLEELGQIYLWIGIEELFKYANSSDLKSIGQWTKDTWDELADQKNCDLPVHLANTMINYAKKNKFPEKLSSKWRKSEREIEKHIMPMAAYITEGIIDVLD